MSTEKPQEIQEISRDPLFLRWLEKERHSGDDSRAALVDTLLEEGSAQDAWAHIYHQAVADRLGLNDTDHKCLHLIKAGPMTPGELARITSLTTGAVTAVLDRLERLGFVKREHDSEDRRRIIVRADIEKLKTEVAPLFGCLQEGFTGLCQSYSEDQLRFLIDYFRKNQAMLKQATETLRAQEAAALLQPIATTT